MIAHSIFAIGADDSIHLDRMVYERKLNDERRKQAVEDLIGDTRLSVQVSDSEDPLAIDTLNMPLNFAHQASGEG